MVRLLSHLFAWAFLLLIRRHANKKKGGKGLWQEIGALNNIFYHWKQTSWKKGESRYDWLWEHWKLEYKIEKNH